MDQHRVNEVANSSLQKAREYAAQENWSRAFAHFLTVLELLPEDRENFEDEFENVLSRLGELLYRRKSHSDLLRSYDEGIRYFPSNVTLLNEMGSYLLRLEEPGAALYYLQKAYINDTSDLLVEKNFNSAKLDIIPRWHFRMLNDRKRNNAYRIAIHNAIDPQHNRVLDIGAGCGLLTYYASQCKDVESIIAIEDSKTLSKMATNVLRDIENVRVVNNHSVRLNAVDIGLSNLLVTEIFDCGLFGERVLETLVHAWDNLLEPSAKVIPHSAKLFVTGINSEIILSKNRFFNEIPQLKLDNVCVRQYTAEPYEAENLEEKNAKFMTNTQEVVNINFNDIQQLRGLRTGAGIIPSCTLKCLQSGSIHAFAVWFDLHLDDSVMITTNPLKDNVKCWEQAVVYVDHPVTVQEGEEITIQFFCAHDRLRIDILDRPSTCSGCFEIEPEMITYLNDVQVVEAAEDLQLPDSFNQRPCQVLDLNPVPLFALFRAKRGFPGNYQCVSIGYSDKVFLDFLWRRNGFVPLDEANNDTKITFQILGWYEVYQKLELNSLDVIYINPVSKNGTLSEQNIESIPDLTLALKRNGIILPREVTLQVELIDSKYLDFCHKVEEENLLGFKVADHMNVYSTLEQWQVQPQYYQRKTLCSLITGCNLLTNGFPSSSSSYEVTVPINGNANGVLYWYKIEYSENVSINTYKSLHYNGACFVFEQPQLVKSGDKLTISIHQNKGLLKICCDENDEEDEGND